MIPYPLQIVKGCQAELRREAEMNRLSRVANRRNPSLIKWKLFIAIASAIGVVLKRRKYVSANNNN